MIFSLNECRIDEWDEKFRRVQNVEAMDDK